LPGCAALGAVGAAAGAIDRVMDVAGVGKGRDAESSKPVEVAMKINAGERLNASGSGQPLSLVLRVYTLRSAERLKALAYARLSAPEGEREALGEDLVAVRELVLIPGKSYTLNLKMPGETSTIGVTGLFRAPYADRWKLAFDARQSADSGIVIGAHACALTASAGALINDTGPAASLVGVQCNR
jgi:type VI secretion system protein VasD